MRAKSTIYEVARKSGVSTATVSRVMQSGTGFSEDTRRRVLDAARELGWVPNGTARGLAARRVGIVGLLFPDLGEATEGESESPLFVDQVIRGAERAATLAGDAVLIASTRGSTGHELARRVAGKVDGLIVSAPALSGEELADIARSLPVVVITSRAGRTGYDVVSADNRGGAAAITTHLLTVHGYDDIAFVAGPRQSPDSKERFAGFRTAMAAAGHPQPTAPDAHGDFTERGGARAMRELLSGDRKTPRAIVFGNDEMALGAMAVMRERKLRAPGDIALTGFDDIAAARHARPGLTTVRQPMRQLGEEAVRAVFARLGDQAAPRRVLTLPTELVVRSSCGCRSIAAARATTHPSSTGGSRT